MKNENSARRKVAMAKRRWPMHQKGRHQTGKICSSAQQRTVRKAQTANAALAKALWGELTPQTLNALRHLTTEHSLSIGLGDLLLLDGRWYVTHSGLLRVASRNRCAGIQVQRVRALCNAEQSKWAFKATAYKSTRCKGFVGYGDADPSNVSNLVRGAELRVAETRAVNRALRKAYGIGLCSVEEIGSFPGPLPPASPNSQNQRVATAAEPQNGHRLRDRLCLLIRQHQLDAAQVKSYANHFCGTETLRQATREQVESFVNHLVELASQGRDKLVAQLARHAEAQPTDDLSRSKTEAA